jgi:ATP-dependent helicase IRC3
VTINSRTGDYNPTSLAQVINTPVVNRLVVQAWLDRAGNLQQSPRRFNRFIVFIANRKSSLVFCVNLAHVRELTCVFREAGIDARYITSKTPAAEREALISSFKVGEFSVLVNCGECIPYSRNYPSEYHVSWLAILTEGADIPNIDCVLVARPTRSRNILAQMVRRISVCKGCDLF